jgi:phosphopantothenoylcysteine decarboxylase/phosphopantothenate--cysteine ligase
VPTRDILASLASAAKNFLVVGFAAETNNVAQHAQEKLRAKNCDLMIANDVSDSRVGMESDENAVTVYFRDGTTRVIARARKREIARTLVKIFSDTHQKCLTKNS